MNRSFFEDDEDLGVQGPGRSRPPSEFGGGYGGGNFDDDHSRFYEGGRVYSGRHASTRPQPSQGWAGSAISEHTPPSGTGRMPKGYRRADTSIRDDVCERLYHRHDLDLTDVEVDVEDGIVRLQGSVTYRAMKHRIEDVASACLGVDDVDNRIRVRRPPDPLAAARPT